jgi:hypothetical protein
MSEHSKTVVEGFSLVVKDFLLRMTLPWSPYCGV